LLSREEAVAVRGVLHVERVERRKTTVVRRPVVPAVALIRPHLTSVEVRFCRYRFCPTGELKYRGAVGLGYRSTYKRTLFV
jgi:hypothetical protein